MVYWPFIQENILASYQRLVMHAKADTQPGDDDVSILETGLDSNLCGNDGGLGVYGMDSGMLFKITHTRRAVIAKVLRPEDGAVFLGYAVHCRAGK